MAGSHKANIAIENLTGIRNARSSKSFRYFFNSWQFYKFRLYLEYKALHRFGCNIIAVDPRYTSKMCYLCKKINNPKGKKYKCSKCKEDIHRDENACYNISDRGIELLNTAIKLQRIYRTQKR